MVTRQRMYQLRNPDKKKEIDKRYRELHKDELRARAKAWRDAFEEEHGMSYHLWRKEQHESND